MWQGFYGAGNMRIQMIAHDHARTWPPILLPIVFQRKEIKAGGTA